MTRLPFRFLTALTCLAVATAAGAAPPQMFGKSAPFDRAALPAGPLKDRLDRLAPAARSRAMTWLHSFDFPAADARESLRADPEGGVLYVDAAPLPGAGDSVDPGVGAAAPIAVTGADAFRLHSRRGASKVLYLDFDGHIVTGTAWNASSGVTRYDAVAYDTDGVAGFGTAELQSIINVWQRVAEDYAAFDVDVTTELPTSFGPTVARAVITRDADRNGVAMPYQGSGGVAYINVFGASNFHTYYSPAFVYFNRLGNGREDYVAEATSHELGHNLGLSHDGTSTATYYGGHGSGATSWGAIMGSSYGRAVSQFSKGEYAGANNTQDDVAVVTGKLALRSDDHGGTNAGATLIVADANGVVSSTTAVQDIANAKPENKGVIGTRADVDVFTFNAGAGTVNLTVTPQRMGTNTLGGNLDIEAKLYAAGGALLASALPTGDTRATLTATVPAGQYFLHIAGGGDSVSPYSDYGSLGQYFINGSIPVGIANTVAPSPNPMVFEVAPAATSASSIAMRAITAIDDAGAAVQYRFDCVSGGTGCVATGTWQSARDFTANGLAGGGTYAFRVLARDAWGNQTSPSTTLSATTPSANRSPVAVSDKGATAKRGTITLPVLNNDSDPDGDALRITAVTKPAKGSVSFTATNVVYTNGGRNGNDSFSYTISDGRGGVATATVTVSVSVK